ncbi:MAG TPA: MFS transporter [Gaiellaceae bacterium]|nr:MFS transporter [Gaiellaceae bacterium]
MQPRGRLGALAERNFRFVFSSTSISAFGDGVSTVALAFAVLHIGGSATALGLVIAARQGAAAAITIAAGVWADRLPRHLVLVSAATVQGTMQAVAGALVISGAAEVWMLVALALGYGLADGFVIPTSQGLIPAIVSSARLQQANALLGLSQSALRVVGPAVGGVLVAAGSPGGALLVDAATFAAAALLLVRVSIPKRADSVVAEPFLAEMRQGWNEFRRQTWIWTTIVFFGIGNCAAMSTQVLGPLVAKDDYNGAGTWALLVSSFGIGTIAGGLAALRFRVGRPLAAACLFTIPWLLQPLGLALQPPVPVVVAIYALAGIGIAIHLALWFTVFQQHVPAESLSRVSSYDVLGSIVLVPVGAAIAGPVAALIGVSATLFGAFGIMVVCFAAVVTQPSVWAIRNNPGRLAGAEAAA